MSTVRVSITVSIEAPSGSPVVQPQSYTLADSRTTGDNPLYYVRTVRDLITTLQGSMHKVVETVNGDIDKDQP